MNKFLVVGLGNPGEKYQENRHNIGFKIVDSLAKRHNVSFENDKYGEVSTVTMKGRQIVLLKPSTFMNLSGKSVRHHLIKNKIKLTNLLVIGDDLNLPFGKIKLKGKGSDGGHNGHKDIIKTLGTSGYSRLKFGIDNNFYPGEQTRYVLSDWPEEEEAQLDNFINPSVDAIINFCTLGIDRTMSQV